MYVGARLGVAYCRRMVPTPTPTVSAGYRATDATGDEIKTWLPPPSPRAPRYNVNHFSKKHSFYVGRGRLIITNENGHNCSMELQRRLNKSRERQCKSINYKFD